MKGRSILNYPFLFLLLFPLFILARIENDYHHIINYRFVGKEIFYLFLAPILIFGTLFLLRRNAVWAGAQSFFPLLIFYYLGILKPLLKNSFLGQYVVLLPVLLLLAAIVFISINKTDNRARFINYLNLLFTILLLIEVVSFFVPRDRSNLSPSKDHPFAQIPACDTCLLPDIYYVVFDGYSSSNILQKEFNYANPLDSLLRSNGFHVSDNSTSNYNLTPFSISSTLNASYMKGIDTVSPFYQNDFMPAIYTVFKNGMFPYLKEKGYETTNISIFNIENNPSLVPSFDMWDEYSLYERHNAVATIYRDLGYHLPFLWRVRGGGESYANDRDTFVNRTITGFRHQKPSTKPSFIYTHFFLPHSPFTWDSSGYKGYTHFTKEEEKRAAYIEQVKYCNRIIQEEILPLTQVKRSRPVVIILQSDHGYRFGTDDPRQTFQNLSAVYFSDKDYSSIPDSLSNVNTFRVVLNKYFGGKLPLLKNEQFFLKHQ